MLRLSVNVNKVATLRNSRGKDTPSVLAAVRACIEAGAHGITVHPRSDERHIRRADVLSIAEELRPHRDHVEFNIEGDARADLIDLVEFVRPHQFTLVPVLPGELTSQAGWPPDTAVAPLSRVVERVRAAGVRVSVFIDPVEEAVRWAKNLGADRIELFTEPYAEAFTRGPAAARASFEHYVRVAELAHALALGINAGHDLDLANLELFRDLPHLAEVSIGHALMSEALFDGLGTVVKRYLDRLANA